MRSHLFLRQDGLSDGAAPADPGPGSKNYPWGWFVFAIFVLIVILFFSWFIFSRLRARRLGLATPSLNPFSDANRIPSRNYPATGGVVGWAQSKWRNFRTGRRVPASGGYENTSRRGAQRAHFGALDPDEAWDARVGHEADEYGAYGGYEEQELGLASNAHPPAGSQGYGPASGVAEVTHGRDAHRELDERYDEAMGGGHSSNPFDDSAEHSNLKNVDPMPHEEPSTHAPGQRGERRSAFKENV